MRELVAFTWGYDGWGNYTHQLVESTDAVENARGFAPPLFVDIRIRRSVRAVGFRDRAFETLLGPDRYRWMRGLGNRRVIEDTAGAIVINRPMDADLLLDEILGAREAGRRVIFFCACNSPRLAAVCHRAVVADLVRERARARNTVISIDEWPGGAPVSTTLPLSPTHMKRALAGQLKNVPLPAGVDLAWAAGLPHYSRIATEGSRGAIISGPAICTARGWMLPVHDLLHDETWRRPSPRRSR